MSRADHINVDNEDADDDDDDEDDEDVDDDDDYNVELSLEAKMWAQICGFQEDLQNQMKVFQALISKQNSDLLKNGVELQKQNANMLNEMKKINDFNQKNSKFVRIVFAGRKHKNIKPNL